ncbi:MAG: V-type ATP synthase subunit A, partial [Oscillospiraceae bacterium]|nr:V-type ATP synthase subunit A [Oscillospiraceae bacterium]
MNNEIFSVNGPVVKVKDTKDFSMLEMVYVGEKRLIGEVIGITEEFTTIQVYEVTTGLKPGEPVYPTGSPMCATLAPGIITNIFDGIQRPLKKIEEFSGAFIAEGANVPALDEERLFDVKVVAKPGDALKGGDIYAICPETPLIEHRC